MNLGQCFLPVYDIGLLQDIGGCGAGDRGDCEVAELAGVRGNL